MMPFRCEIRQTGLPGSVVLDCCLNALTINQFEEIYSIGQTSDLAEGQ